MVSTGSDSATPYPEKPLKSPFVGGGAGGVTLPKNEETPRPVTEHRYVTKRESKVKLIDVRFREKELFDTLRSFPFDVGRMLDNGFYLSPKMYIGIKRRGTAYLNDFFAKNPEIVLTERQHTILYEIFAVYGGFTLFDDLVAWIQNARAENDDAALKGDLRSYPRLSKEQEDEEKQRVRIDAESTFRVLISKQLCCFPEELKPQKVKSKCRCGEVSTQGFWKGSDLLVLCRKCKRILRCSNSEVDNT